MTSELRIYETLRPETDFSARAFLDMVEAQGLSGAWHWIFATGEQIWSPGLVRLLGLQGAGLAPGYGRLLDLVHPEDRPSLETPAQVMQGLLEPRRFRLLRPNGGIVWVTSRGEIQVGPDGRPRAASGILLDVTDGEALAQAHRDEWRRRWSLFEQTHSWTHSALYADAQRVGSQQILSLTGLSQEEFAADCTRVVAPDDRERTRDRVRALMAAGRPFETEKQLILADGGQAGFRFVYAPVRDGAGRIETWATVATRVGGPKGATVDGAIQDGLESGIGGTHLRAGRALLDWSMMNLAEASGLSFSTIRRLEEDDPGALARSRGLAVAALRRAGIGFLVTAGNAIAVVRY